MPERTKLSKLAFHEGPACRAGNPIATVTSVVRVCAVVSTTAWLKIAKLSLFNTAGVELFKYDYHRRDCGCWVLTPSASFKRYSCPVKKNVYKD
jgi:hypothetical protein